MIMPLRDLNIESRAKYEKTIKSKKAGLKDSITLSTKSSSASRISTNYAEPNSYNVELSNCIRQLNETCREGKYYTYQLVTQNNLNKIVTYFSNKNYLLLVSNAESQKLYIGIVWLGGKKWADYFVGKTATKDDINKFRKSEVMKLMEELCQNTGRYWKWVKPKIEGTFDIDSLKPGNALIKFQERFSKKWPEIFAIMDKIK